MDSDLKQTLQKFRHCSTPRQRANYNDYWRTQLCMKKHRVLTGLTPSVSTGGNGKSKKRKLIIKRPVRPDPIPQHKTYWVPDVVASSSFMINELSKSPEIAVNFAMRGDLNRSVELLDHTRSALVIPQAKLRSVELTSTNGPTCTHKRNRSYGIKDLNAIMRDLPPISQANSQQFRKKLPPESLLVDSPATQCQTSTSVSPKSASKALMPSVPKKIARPIMRKTPTIDSPPRLPPPKEPIPTMSDLRLFNRHYSSKPRYTKPSLVELEKRELFEQDIQAKLKDILPKEFAGIIRQSNAVLVRPPALAISYKYYIGPGNNSFLIKHVLDSRTWWTKTDAIDQAHFIWMQWNDPEVYEYLSLARSYENARSSLEVTR